MNVSAVKSALAILGLSLAACGGPAGEADTSQSQEGVTATNCDQYGVIDQGEYKVQNDEWNSTARQCITSTGANFTVTTANFNLGNGAPATYPSIFKGCHWGNCTPNSGMPVQVSSIGSATSNVSFNIPGGYTYDAAYDIWYNSSPTTSGQPNGAEVMIWVSHAGFPNPVGSKVGTANISGANWDVWYGNVGWNVISYVRNPPANSASVDIKAFTNDSVSRGYIQRAWYMIAIECGFEIWVGGQNMAVTSFSASVSSGSNGGGGGGGSGPFQLSVSKSGSGSGTVTSNPSGINCGGSCNANFNNGTNVTLTAQANSGSTFTGWSGACGGTGNCTVSMTQARSVTANFNSNGGGGGGGGSTGCTTISGGQSGNFNTTGAVCYTVNAAIHGWGCSNADGRTVTVNGSNVSCGQMPLPGSSPYTFRFTGGSVPWTSMYWW